MVHNTDSLRLAWTPHYNASANGYGFIAARMARALRDAGARMVRADEDDWHWRIDVGVPAHYVTGRQRQPDMIAHTMYECDPLPPFWPAILNKYAAVWVPSRWCADLFAVGGVTVPILASGYGVDGTYFYPDERRDWFDLRRPLRYGVWAHAFGDRKNAMMAVEAFFAAAVPAAEMEVKVTFAYDATGIRGPNGQRVTVHRGAWDTERLAAWLRSIDVLLYLSGGEGFGLQPLEAMSSGCVVICAANSGMLDYLTADNSLMLSCPDRRIDESYQKRFGENVPYTTFNPVIDDVIAAIRLASERRDTLLPRLSAGALATAQRMTWERAGAEIINKIKTLSHEATS